MSEFDDPGRFGFRITREKSRNIPELITSIGARLTRASFAKDDYVSGWWQIKYEFETKGYLFNVGVDSETFCDDCPGLIAAGIDRYNEEGIEPGSFVRAVLENDLKRAIEAASPESLAHLPAIMQYVRAWVRAEAKGSKEAVATWLAKTAVERGA